MTVKEQGLNLKNINTVVEARLERERLAVEAQSELDELEILDGR